jgi:hypothetical protein
LPAFWSGQFVKSAVLRKQFCVGLGDFVAWRMDRRRSRPEATAAFDPLARLMLFSLI